MRECARELVRKDVKESKNKKQRDRERERERARERERVKDGSAIEKIREKEIE